jgi:hypothetical protein
LALGLFLFLSQWLFVYARSTSKLQAWANGSGRHIDLEWARHMVN